MEGIQRNMIKDRANLDLLVSIQSQWVWAIIKGIKRFEIRKNKPSPRTPFKCLIYCTKEIYCGNMKLVLSNSKELKDSLHIDQEVRAIFVNQNLDTAELYNAFPALNGTIVGEFACDSILEIPADESNYGTYDISDDDLALTCLTQEDLWEYGKGKTLYGWHISDLIVYDHPKPLQAFVEKAPQSWCYVRHEK